jgi:N-acetylmuramoyl-L-alanine amidase
MALCLAILGLSALVAPPASAEPDPPPPAGEPFPMSDDAISLISEERIVAHLIDGQEIYVAALPEEGEGYMSIARRLCGNEDRWPALKAANGGREVILNRAVEVPWDLLREEFRYLALRAMFPEDRPVEGGYRHHPSRARAETYGQGLWQVALWFTGRGENWTEIADANGLSGPELPSGRPLKIPEGLLLPLFRRVEASDDGKLAYGADDTGTFAVYRLKRREALYSAVVLRYTGLVDHADVQRAVARVAQRSGIDDPTDIPIGYPVKIPLDLLSVEYLPRNHPRRVVSRVSRTELASVALGTGPKSLKGVHVLIDPGHGGKDLGAITNGVWESDYVYDIGCRVKRRLEKSTGANVWMLLEDSEHGCRVFESPKIPRNGKEVVLTDPPHRNKGGASTRMGVNLRWYLSNAIFRELTGKQGVDPRRIVFVSLHADSLHRSLRGGMVYVPGERFRRRRYGVHGGSYRRFAEVRSAKPVSVARDDRLRDEKISTKLAEKILEAYEAHELPVHHNEPVRNHIVRSLRGRTRRYVPAVLGGNLIPTKVLVETLNLNNDRDAKLMSDPEGRERVAEAIVSGLESFFE